MAAASRLQTALVFSCLALVTVRAQSAWPPPTPGGVDPTPASSAISRQFISEEQHDMLTSPTFGKRLTTRPRPATRRDWTPIWPGDGDGGGAAETSAPRPSAPSSAPPSGRPPVTEYYFDSAGGGSAEGGAAGAGEATADFPSAQLPTATFASPSATRALPSPSTRPGGGRPGAERPGGSRPGGSRPGGSRPGGTRLGLADRLSALVTSRPARTRIISPTRVAAAPPSSVPFRPVTAATEADVAGGGGDGPGLEPSTQPPLAPARTGPTAVPEPPTAAAAAATAPTAAAPTDLSPTPVSAPCVVTPQGPGGYCRDGDLLTVLTRDPAGNWQAYRTVQLPSSTVAALDGKEADAAAEPAATADPVGVTAAPTEEPAGQSTPAEDTGATVTSGPPQPTAETVRPLAEPEEAGTGPADRPTAPTPTRPTGPSAGSTDGTESAGDGDGETLPTATSAVPGPQPPTVGTWAGTGVGETSAASAPTPPSEEDKSGASPQPSDVPADRSEDEKRTTQPPTDPTTQPATTLAATTQPATTQTATTQPSTEPDTEPPTQAATRPTTRRELRPTSPSWTRPTTGRRPRPTTPPPTTPTPPPTTPSERPAVTGAAPAALTLPPLQDLPEITGPPPRDGEAPMAGGPAATTPAPAEATWQTQPPSTHPETTLHPGSKSTSRGKVSVADHPTPTAASNSSWGPDDGFQTGTYHVTTTSAMDYPSGPTGFTGPAGPRPTHQTVFPPGSSRRPGTTRRFPTTVATTPTSFGGDFFGGGTRLQHNGTSTGSTLPPTGRLTPPPPPPHPAHSPHSSPPPGTTGTPGPTGPTGPTGFTGLYPPFGPTGFTTRGTELPTEPTGPPSTGLPETTPGGGGETAGTGRPPGITHSAVVPPVETYVQFLIGATWPRFCRLRRAFKQRVVDLVNGDAHSNLTVANALLFNIPICGRPVRARRETEPATILVFLYLTDAEGRYAPQLTERVEPLWEAAAAGGDGGGGGGGGGDMARLVREVDTIRPAPLVAAEEHSERAGIIAAITVGCVAVASVVLLAVLLVVLRHRRRAAQTAQRCNPVNMEEYGVESVFSSMRRKNKLRRSVRSYLNQAFDDHDAPSNAVNFAGLANLSGDLAALKEEFESIPSGAMPTLDDLPPGSEDRNRYANVLPVPETRVVLEQKAGEPNSDYINANYVRGPKDEPQFYIATQGPLESTVNDFWRMVWETQSKVVICLTDIVERGVRRCAEYLPPSEALDRHRLYGDFQVTLMAKAKKDKFVVSTVQLKNMDSNLFREVTHLWYSGWPERGVPSDLDSLVEFLLESRRAMKTNIGPAVVHCSPGTGRTGVLLACDICVRQFEASRTADIMRTVFRIRQDRAGAVQTREQYALIYKVLNQYAASVTSGNLPAFE